MRRWKFNNSPTDVAQQIDKVQWQWAGHIARKIYGQCEQAMLAIACSHRRVLEMK